MSSSGGFQPDKRPAAQLDLQFLMDHGGVGCVVLRHLASTQDRVRICRSVSKVGLQYSHTSHRHKQGSASGPAHTVITSEPCMSCYAGMP